MIMTEGQTGYGKKEKKVPFYIKKRFLIAGLVIMVFVASAFGLIDPFGLFKGASQSAAQTATSGGGSPAGPAAPAPTETPMPTAKLPATPEQIRDLAISSTSADADMRHTFLRAENVTKAFCQYGFKARTVTFRLFLPTAKSIDETFRAVTVVEYNGGYIYLHPDFNTPTISLGTSNNPIPKEEELRGAKLDKGTDDFGKYC